MNELNDSLDDLLSAEFLATPRTATRAPESFVENKVFIEGCPACRGTGRWRPGYPCFKCKGKGTQTFKSSPEVRKAARQDAAQKRVQKLVELQDEIEAWKTTNAEVWAWILQSMDSFSFAASMNEALHKFGSLTDGRLAACQRCVDKRNAARLAAEEKKANAPAVASEGIDRLKEAFDKAKAYAAAKATGLTIRNPKITIGGMTISPAKANSANPGALYVVEGEQYLGKIQNGHFYGVRDCRPEQETKILQFVADPAAAAKVYGQETGVCCVCNATLKSEWRLRGIGPICAEKMGW